MLTKEFNFDLPEELIAQSPSEKRGGDRLLILDKQSGKFEDRLFTELPEILPKNALMDLCKKQYKCSMRIFND